MDELLQQVLRELPGGPAAQRIMICHELTSLSELAAFLDLSTPELIHQLREDALLYVPVKLHDAS